MELTKPGFSVKRYILPICALCIVLIYYFGSPWGHIVCRLKVQHYLKQFPEETTIECNSMYYDSLRQLYVFSCYDVEREMYFEMWCEPYDSQMCCDYTIRCWEVEVERRYSEKYPEYISGFYTSMEYPFRVYHPDERCVYGSDYTVEECDYLLSLEATFSVTTNESLTLGIPEELEGLLMDIYSDFHEAAYYDVFIHNSDDALIVHVHDIPELLGLEL